MTSSFRLILDPPRFAGLNMAIDEILMETQSLSGALPVLRFYSWSEPAYTVGYFQNVAEVTGRFQCGRHRIPVVRRITGGGLVLHGRDLTFSLAVKSSNPFFAGETKRSYLKVSEALRVGLQSFYPAIDYADCRNIPSGRGKGGRVCFEAPSCYDLLLDGKKIAGASQRRSKAVILHQSSVFLGDDREGLIRKILEGFQKVWRVHFFEVPLSEEELALAKQREKERCASADWAYLPDLERSFSS